MLHHVYVLPALGMLTFAAILVIADLKLPKYSVLVLGIVVTLFQIWQYNQTDFETIKKAKKIEFNNHMTDFQRVKEVISGKNAILATGNHVFNYYTSSKKIQALHRYSIIEPDFYQRKNYDYVNIVSEIEEGKYEVIIILKWMKYPEAKLQSLESLGYKKETLNTIYLFYKE